MIEFDFLNKFCRAECHSQCHGNWTGLGFNFTCNCTCHEKTRSSMRIGNDDYKSGIGQITHVSIGVSNRIFTPSASGTLKEESKK